MARDDEIDHATDRQVDREVDPQIVRQIDTILARGRQVRSPLPRGLWIASGLVGVTCAAAFAYAMLVAPRPVHTALERRTSAPERVGGPGFVAGVAVGGAAGLALGVALARQRRDHSSRKRP